MIYEKNVWICGILRGKKVDLRFFAYHILTVRIEIAKPFLSPINCFFLFFPFCGQKVTKTLGFHVCLRSTFSLLCFVCSRVSIEHT